MIFRKKSLDVTEINANNEDFAMVICKMNNYKDMISHVQIGESIATNDSFKMNFDGFTSKWKIIFFPKGQYDYGIASRDCRIYIKLISCEERETIKMNIQIYLLSTSSSSNHSLSHHEDISVFNINDKNKSWAGPFALQPPDHNDILNDNLMIKCVFKVYKNKDTLLNYKRSLSEIDSSPTKKARSVSPCASKKDDHNSKVSEVKVFPMDPPPNPFEKKSPLLYARLTQHRPSRSSNHSEQNYDKKEHSVNDPQGRLKFTHMSRKIIFSPTERAEIREYQKLASSCDKLSINMSDNMQNQISQPQKKIKTNCLSVSDIVGDKDPDKKDIPVEKGETSTSESDKLSEDESNNLANSVQRRLHYFESLSN